MVETPLMAHPVDYQWPESNCPSGTKTAKASDIVRMMNAALHYPKVTGTALALFSVSAGAVLLLAADFGAPGWVFVPLVLWLATIGLPSTVAVLLVASVWGTTPPLYGLWIFCLVATLLAVCSHVWTLKAVARLGGGSHEM